MSAASPTGGAGGADDPSLPGVVLAERARRFVPREVLRRVQTHAIDGSSVDRLLGAVGIFDISGFTKLSSTLRDEEQIHAQLLRDKTHMRHSSFGRMGDTSGKTKFADASMAATSAEALASQLNIMFGSVISVIERFGGDIFKFVGDAMIVMFTFADDARRTSATAEDLARLGLQALGCAMECVKAIKALNSPLGIHISLAVGPILHCIAGGYRGKYESFIAGPASSESFEALDYAKTGEIVVPKTLFVDMCKMTAESGCATIEGARLGSGRHAGFVRVATFAATPAWLASVEGLGALPEPTENLGVRLTPFLVEPVLAALDPRRSGARCEMRKIAVLFIMIGGIGAASALAEDAKQDATFLRTIQKSLLAVQEACSTHGAILRQFVYDDKGFIAVVCVGLANKLRPPELQDKPLAVSALLVAARFMAKLPKVAKVTRFGVTEGDCFCGPVGATPEAATMAGNININNNMNNNMINYTMRKSFESPPSTASSAIEDHHHAPKQMSSTVDKVATSPDGITNHHHHHHHRALSAAAAAAASPKPRTRRIRDSIIKRDAGLSQRRMQAPTPRSEEVKETAAEQGGDAAAAALFHKTTTTGATVGDDDSGSEDEFVVRAGRQEYAVVGDAVNLAARLMSKAEPGQVLVDSRVHDVGARHDFVFDECDPFTPKGKTVPIRNFLLVATNEAVVNPDGAAAMHGGGRKSGAHEAVAAKQRSVRMTGGSGFLDSKRSRASGMVRGSGFLDGKPSRASGSMVRGSGFLDSKPNRASGSMVRGSGFLSAAAAPGSRATSSSSIMVLRDASGGVRSREGSGVSSTTDFGDARLLSDNPLQPLYDVFVDRGGVYEACARLLLRDDGNDAEASASLSSLEDGGDLLNHPQAAKTTSKDAPTSTRCIRTKNDADGASNRITTTTTTRALRTLVIAGGAGQGKTALVHCIALCLASDESFVLYTTCQVMDQKRGVFSSFRNFAAQAVRLLLRASKRTDGAQEANGTAKDKSRGAPTTTTTTTTPGNNNNNNSNNNNNDGARFVSSSQKNALSTDSQRGGGAPPSSSSSSSPTAHAGTASRPPRLNLSEDGASPECWGADLRQEPLAIEVRGPAVVARRSPSSTVVGTNCDLKAACLSRKRVSSSRGSGRGGEMLHLEGVEDPSLQRELSIRRSIDGGGTLRHGESFFDDKEEKTVVVVVDEEEKEETTTGAAHVDGRVGPLQLLSSGRHSATMGRIGSLNRMVSFGRDNGPSLDDFPPEALPEDHATTMSGCRGSLRRASTTPLGVEGCVFLTVRESEELSLKDLLPLENKPLPSAVAPTPTTPTTPTRAPAKSLITSSLSPPPGGPSPHDVGPRRASPDGLLAESTAANTNDSGMQKTSAGGGQASAPRLALTVDVASTASPQKVVRRHHSQPIRPTEDALSSPVEGGGEHLGPDDRIKASRRCSTLGMDIILNRHSRRDVADESTARLLDGETKMPEEELDEASSSPGADMATSRRLGARRQAEDNTAAAPHDVSRESSGGRDSLSEESTKTLPPPSDGAGGDLEKDEEENEGQRGARLSSGAVSKTAFSSSQEGASSSSSSSSLLLLLSQGEGTAVVEVSPPPSSLPGDPATLPTVVCQKVSQQRQLSLIRGAAHPGVDHPEAPRFRRFKAPTMASLQVARLVELGHIEAADAKYLVEYLVSERSDSSPSSRLDATGFSRPARQSMLQHATHAPLIGDALFRLIARCAEVTSVDQSEDEAAAAAAAAAARAPAEAEGPTGGGGGVLGPPGSFLALVLDNAHHLDPMSCDLLARLRAAIPAMRLVVSHRPLAEKRSGCFDQLVATLCAPPPPCLSGGDTTPKHGSESPAARGHQPRTPSGASNSTSTINNSNNNKMKNRLIALSPLGSSACRVAPSPSGGGSPTALLPPAQGGSPTPLSCRGLAQQHHHHHRGAVVVEGERKAVAPALELTLGPLTRSQTRKLVASGPYRGVDIIEVEPALIDFVLERSSGNPGLVLEVVHELDDKHISSYDDQSGVLSLAKDAREVDFDVPASVRAQVTTAFDCIDNALQGLLRLASVLGARVEVICLKYLFWSFFGKHLELAQGSHAPQEPPNPTTSTTTVMTASSSSKQSSRHLLTGELTFEVTGIVNFNEVCARLVATNYFVRHDDAHLNFASDLTRRVIYHQMVASDHKKIHAQVVAWQTTRLSSRAMSRRPSMTLGGGGGDGGGGGGGGGGGDTSLLLQGGGVGGLLSAKAQRAMAVYGDIAYHALCCGLPVLAFHFCTNAFKHAIRAKLVDVALGYVNDCALISENHDLPEDLAATAQVGMMRATAYIVQGDYDAAVENLELIVDATHHTPGLRCLLGGGSCAFLLADRVFRKNKDGAVEFPFVKTLRLRLAGDKVFVDFPAAPASSLELYTAYASRGPPGGHRALGRRAYDLQKQLRKANDQIRNVKRKLECSFNVGSDSRVYPALALPHPNLLDTSKTDSPMGPRGTSLKLASPVHGAVVNTS